MPLPGGRKEGRPRKMWSECVKNDIEACNMSALDPQNRDTWRKAIKPCQVLPTPNPGKPAAP